MSSDDQHDLLVLVRDAVDQPLLKQLLQQQGVQCVDGLDEAATAAEQGQKWIVVHQAPQRGTQYFSISGSLAYLPAKWGHNMLLRRSGYTLGPTKKWVLKTSLLTQPTAQQKEASTRSIEQAVTAPEAAQTGSHSCLAVQCTGGHSFCSREQVEVLGLGAGCDGTLTIFQQIPKGAHGAKKTGFKALVAADAQIQPGNANATCWSKYAEEQQFYLLQVSCQMSHAEGRSLPNMQQLRSDYFDALMAQQLLDVSPQDAAALPEAADLSGGVAVVDSTASVGAGSQLESGASAAGSSNMLAPHLSYSSAGLGNTRSAASPLGFLGERSAACPQHDQQVALDMNKYLFDFLRHYASQRQEPADGLCQQLGQLHLQTQQLIGQVFRGPGPDRASALQLLEYHTEQAVKAGSTPAECLAAVRRSMKEFFGGAHPVDILLDASLSAAEKEALLLRGYVEKGVPKFHVLVVTCQTRNPRDVQTAASAPPTATQVATDAMQRLGALSSHTPPQMALDNEARHIKDTMATGIFNLDDVLLNEVEVEICRDVSIKELEQQLKASCDLLHFAGHSHNGSLQIGRVGCEEPLPYMMLAAMLLHTCPNLKAVVLNSCGTKMLLQTGFRELLQRGVQLVAGLGDVSDRNALNFSKAFYHTLCAGGDIPAAVQAGRKHTEGEHGRFELYLCPSDTASLATSQAPPAPQPLATSPVAEDSDTSSTASFAHWPGSTSQWQSANGGCKQAPQAVSPGGRRHAAAAPAALGDSSHQQLAAPQQSGNSSSPAASKPLSSAAGIHRLLFDREMGAVSDSTMRRIRPSGLGPSATARQQPSQSPVPSGGAAAHRHAAQATPVGPPTPEQTAPALAARTTSPVPSSQADVPLGPAGASGGAAGGAARSWWGNTAAQGTGGAAGVHVGAPHMQSSGTSGLQQMPLFSGHSTQSTPPPSSHRRPSTPPGAFSGPPTPPQQTHEACGQPSREPQPAHAGPPERRADVRPAGPHPVRPQPRPAQPQPQPRPVQPQPQPPPAQPQAPPGYTAQPGQGDGGAPRWPPVPASITGDSRLCLEMLRQLYPAGGNHLSIRKRMRRLVPDRPLEKAQVNCILHKVLLPAKLVVMQDKGPPPEWYAQILPL